MSEKVMLSIQIQQLAKIAVLANSLENVNKNEFNLYYLAKKIHNIVKTGTIVLDTLNQQKYFELLEAIDEYFNHDLITADKLADIATFETYQILKGENINE